MSSFSTQRIFMSFMLASALVTCSCSRQGDQLKEVNAADYGLSQEGDNTRAMVLALQACKEQGAERLIIPMGTYHLYPEKAEERYVHISNNDDGLKRIVFALEGFENLEIDGRGSHFICHDYIMPFHLKNSKNICLKNFSVDWAMPFYFQAEVIDVHPEKNAFDLKVFEECIYEIQGDQLVFTNKKLGKNTWMNMAPLAQEDIRWTQNINWNIWFDSKTKSPVFNVEIPARLHSWNRELNRSARAEEIEPDIVRLYDAAAMLPEVGWTIIIKGRKEFNRMASVINISLCKDIHIENVNVHHSSGIALLAAKSENISLFKYNVLLPENSGRLVSTTADATHFIDCRGLIKMDSCVFENMLDDATNVHGAYASVLDIIDTHTVGMARGHSQQQGNTFASEGDRVVLKHNDKLTSYDTLTVASVNNINSYYFELTFEETLPEFDPATTVADNASWQADVQMSNCTVRNNRARSILLSTSGKLLVENNHFLNCTYTGVMIAGHVDFWYESGPVRDLTIRNNVFENMGLGGGNAPIMTVSGNINKGVKPPFYFNRNIVFDNNIIRTFGREVIAVSSGQNIQFTNNTILRSEQFPVLADENGPVFRFNKCKDVLIENNKYLWGKHASIQAIETENLEIRNNEGIE